MTETKKARKSTPAGKKSRHSSIKPADTVVPGAPELVSDQDTDASEPETDQQDDSARPSALKMQDLMLAIAEESGLKRNQVRRVAGAVLDEMGKALDEGRNIHLPGFGKLSIRRREEAEGGDTVVARIKLHHPEKDEQEPPAENP